MSSMWQSILDLLFPPRCVGCGRPGTLLCPSCLRAAPRVEPPFCRKCGKPLEPLRDKIGLRTSPICSFCLEAPLRIAGIRSPYLFSGVMRKAIHTFKYRGVFALGPVLGNLLAEYLRVNPLPADMVAPVPLHPRRLKERGYDQAEILAKQVASASGLPLGQGWLVRHRHTPPQVKTASALERRNNVSGAFGAGDGLRPVHAVLLVDDVCTTGATLEACAQVLQAAGVPVVWGLTVAREA